MRPAVSLSADCLGWARTAHFVAAVAEDGDIQLRSEVGIATRYFIRRRGSDRLELTQAHDEDREHPVLFVAEVQVLERYLMFADDVREDLDLPMLDQPWRSSDLAADYVLTDMIRGYRTLKRADGVPVAAAPHPVSSLLTLVPLSHYLGWSIHSPFCPALGVIVRRFGAAFCRLNLAETLRPSQKYLANT